MATEAPTNGNTATAEPQSAAEKLLAKHAADEAHKVKVEDVVDEEDLAHPVPSAETTSLSDVAKGKKKVDDAAPAPKPKGPAFDVKSEEAFPALGGPAPRQPAPANTWGKAPQTNGAKPATNGSTNASTRGSTPNMSLPGSNLGLAMPGRHVERISLGPQDIMPRSQLKKPVAEVLREINKRSKASIATKEGPGGRIFFEGTGPVEAVRQALKELVQAIGTKHTIKVPIPASTRPYIIGRQGAVIQGISQKSGAKVQIPKQEDLPTPGGEDDEDEVMVDVVIEGDALGAQMARNMVEEIVNKHTSTVNNMRLKDIPAEFYPFLAGPRNERVGALEGGRDIKIQIPHYHTWKDQAPPQPAAQGQTVQFLAQPSLPIQISGDRLAAQQARSEIDALVAKLRRDLTLNQTPMDRGRHQFIIGDRGLSLHDFLEETGCALIKPPPGVDDDNLYIVGPADKIEGGVDKVMELAEKMHQMNVDIAKPHNSARGGGHPHARNMTRYLQHKQALADLEALHDASIVLPTGADGPTAWEVYSKDFKNATKARQDIMNLVGAHPPSRFQPMQVDPFFHQHLQQREAPRIRREHGVHIVFPDGHSETPDLLLVFEAPGSPTEYVIPRQQPSAADVKAHQQSIQQAQSYIQNILAQQQALESREIEAHPRYNEKIRRYMDREQQGLPQGQFPIQATFPAGRPKASPGFSIRGPSSAVDDMNAKLVAFLEQEIKDEAERGFTTSFDYPQKFANFLIGKRGENINRLREEFDVEIQVKDGKCELKGPEKKCAACKAHIISNLKKLEDETTHTIKVKPQYHRELIGQKGAQVNRLQDRYNVRVNFPRNAPAEDEATEGSVKNFRNQAPDEVIIKGPKRGADEAREELLNLLQWTMDNSHSASVSVQQSQVPSLIGAGGREMESLRLATGAQVDIPNARDAPDASGRVEIKLKGTKKQVEDAKKLLQERAKVFDDTVTKNIDVDQKHHKTLIGTGGTNVRKLVTDAGGPDDNRAIAQIVRFPKQGDADNNIRIQGPKAMVDKIVAAIQAQVEEKAGQVADSMEVPTEKHRILIGRGGEARRQLESKFNISIDIPRQGATGPAASQIKLTGQPSDIAAAKEHIAGLIKEQEGETINVPRKFHHDLSDNGQFFRRLRNDHKVTVDHAGQQPPPRPTGTNPRARANGGTAMPLITDDPAASADAHSWELIDNSSVYDGTDGDETIPWILRGSSENVAKAKAQLEKALAQAGEPSWSGYLILPDPRTYRHIIGPGGSQINSIRKKTGTKVQVPRGQSEGEAVEIVGSKDGCEEAKQIILDIIKNAGNAGPRRGY
ncbi:hypothetical protein EG328_012045 [Venturia inaequalis]|uniref:K Homology domain-containing protein n=1 Tax=Venturia inaequalis TaxID=5025 RepID=A0A8H3V493_VENIN|nr:hypothetical protein EG328_012045 [Venturia inaequalis]